MVRSEGQWRAWNHLQQGQLAWQWAAGCEGVARGFRYGGPYCPSGGG